MSIPLGVNEDGRLLHGACNTRSALNEVLLLFYVPQRALRQQGVLSGYILCCMLSRGFFLAYFALVRPDLLHPKRVTPQPCQGLYLEKTKVIRPTRGKEEEPM